MIDRDRVRSWLRVKPGDFVTLKDAETLSLLLDAGKGVAGVDLQVKSAWAISQIKGPIRWRVCELEPAQLADGEATWFLVVKAVDDEFDVKVMFVPDDFTPGHRQDLLESGSQWVFEAPADESNFSVDELEFAAVIDQTLDDGTKVNYRRKAQGVLFGGVRIDGGDPKFATVVEYAADVECDNPELFLLELGEPDASGAVWLYQGANVGTEDVDVITS